MGISAVIVIGTSRELITSNLRDLDVNIKTGVFFRVNALIEYSSSYSLLVCLSAVIAAIYSRSIYSLFTCGIAFHDIDFCRTS